MKVRILISGLMLVITTALWAQEYDDMYFNSSDRAKLTEKKASELYAANKSTKKKQTTQEEVNANPTDSYSARNINPEYTSRSKSQTAAVDEQDYYLNDYKTNTAKNYSSWYNNYNSWYNNPWYTSAWYGSSAFGSWYSPFYSPYGSWNGYSAFNDPFYNPYYYGSPYSYGSGLSFGMSYSWGSPYSYYPYSSWGSPWGWGLGAQMCWGGMYYPYNTVVVVNGDSRGPAYGKRNSRSSASASSTGYVNNSRNTATNMNNGNFYFDGASRSNTGGRTATTSGNTNTGRQADYYSRSWSRVTQQRSTSGYNTTSDWGSSSYSSPNSSGSRSSSFSHNSFTPSSSGSSSRSSSGYGGGGSSSGSSGGSGGSRSSRGGR
ncbi:MAG TPA: hypothetical protein VFW11_17195 [Cyclobacteriaceae bacterium]|nr:hypothetical protein [Cyclobacteriaceae bacterium]